MKQILVLILVTEALLLFASCMNQDLMMTEPAAEPMIFQTEFVETMPPVTEPPATIPPTDPPESSIPPLGVEAGYYFDSHRSDEYEDYLDYYVYIPEDAVVDMPLVVYLHGDGEVNDPHGLPERGIWRFAKEIYGENFPFVLLEPNTRIKSWTRGNIPELLIELIEAVSNSYSVNVDKIVLTGHSRGAIGVWDMISTYPEYFSAAVPVSSPHEEGHIDYLKAAGVPVWTFAGDIGDIERWYHKYLAQNVDQITVCGGFGKFTVLKGCDHGKAKHEAYVKETFEWMLAQQNGVIPKE